MGLCLQWELPGSLLCITAMGSPENLSLPCSNEHSQIANNMAKILALGQFRFEKDWKVEMEKKWSKLSFFPKRIAPRNYLARRNITTLFRWHFEMVRVGNYLSVWFRMVKSFLNKDCVLYQEAKAEYWHPYSVSLVYDHGLIKEELHA